MRIPSLMILAAALGLGTPARAQDAAPATTSEPEPAAPAAKTVEDEGVSRKWDDEKTDAGGGLLGPVRVGPTFAIGFPHVITYGVDVLWEHLLSGGISTGKTRITAFKPLDASVSSLDVRLRWHPWLGSFFLGVAYGNQTIDASAAAQDLAVTLPGGVKRKVTASFEADARTTYWTPHLGWFTVYDFGLTLGFELGLQMPIKAHTSIDVELTGVSASEENLVKESPEYQKQKKDAKDALDRVATVSLPYITLLRIGWLF